MFDIWLNESKRITREVIEETNLKEVVRQKVTEFMSTKKFEEHIMNTIINAVKSAAQEYAEYYLELRDFDGLTREILKKYLEGEPK